MLQTVIVVGVVLVAAAWLIRRLLASSRGEAACRNCANRGNCSHEEKKPPDAERE